MSRERILFVTGRLAEFPLRQVVESLRRQADFEYDIAVLGISVAALMHADWVLRKLTIDGPFDRVLLPGWCQGDVDRLAQHFDVPFERGPKDLCDLPEHFGHAADEDRHVQLNRYDIEILAEINHAPRLTDRDIVEQAERFRADGADVIDVGCVPGERWNRVGDVVARLCDEGFRVSIDSFDRREVEAAVDAGAELVLSCNATNRDWASRLDAELVAIPDRPDELDTLDRTIDELRGAGCRFRVDPILEPIGYGFARSLNRFYDVRRRWPDLEMMMGIGNLTELTEVDTAGVNVMLAAICQELGIRSVLTTEVINWARTAVREFDLARKLVFHAVRNRVLPKHVGSELVMLRDTKLRELGHDALADLAGRLTDPNVRVFVEGGQIHLMNRDGYWTGTDPYELFDRFVADSEALSASHAFYLGFELCKAVTALHLGKQYVQDQSLDWGFLTVPEISAIGRRKQEAREQR